MQAFDKVVALELAKVCRASYSDPAGVAFAHSANRELVKIVHRDFEWERPAGIFSSHAEFHPPVKTFHAIRVDAPDFRTLGFAGTRNDGDVKRDLDARLVKTDEWPGLVHAGFAAVALQFWDDLKPLPTDKPFEVTG